MADSKLSALTELAVANDTLEMYINDAGTSKKITKPEVINGLHSWKSSVGAGNYHFPIYTTSISGAASFTTVADRMYAHPLCIAQTTTFTRIGTGVQAAGTGSTVYRLGIYTSLRTDYGPDTLVLDAGTVDATSTGLKEITISQELFPGQYWLVVVAQVVSGTPKTYNMSSINASYANHNNTIATGWTAETFCEQSTVSGALPATASTTPTTTSAGPHVYLRVV